MEDVICRSISYKDFRSKINNWSSFEQFLWEAVHSDFPSYSGKVSRRMSNLRLDADFMRGRARKVLPQKRRAHFFTKFGKEERKKGLHVPQKISGKNARFCLFCSKTVNTRSGGGQRKTKREGRRSRTECSKCRVALCTTIPAASSDRRTCFEKWHRRRFV